MSGIAEGRLREERKGWRRAARPLRVDGHARGRVGVAADGSAARFLRGDQKSVRDAALRRRKDHPIGFVARPKKADDGSTDLMIWDVARAARTGPSRRPRSTRPVAGLERHVDEAGLERRRHFDEALRNTAVALV